MSTSDIDAAVGKTVAEAIKSEIELVQAVSENAHGRVEQAEQLAADVIAAAETTAMGVKLAALEERVNSWPGQSSSELSDLHLQVSELTTEIHELKQMTAEMLDLLTELETEETEETELSTQPITPSQTTPEPGRNAKSPEKSAAPTKTKRPFSLL